MGRKFAFLNQRLEDRFYNTVLANKNEEIGGVLFWNWRAVYDMHYKRHEAIFGDSSLCLISDWIICPNVSNLRKRSYMVSDLDQFIAIAEQTAESRGCYFTHFHTHSSGNISPSEADKLHTTTYWARYGRCSIIAGMDNRDRLNMECHEYLMAQDGKSFVAKTNYILWWKYIRQKVRRYERSRGIAIDRSGWQ